MYFPEGNAIQADVNITPVRNVYANADGGTLGTLGSAASPDQYNPGVMMNQNNGNAVAATPSAGGVAWWIALVILVVVMLFAARKTGNADEFKNLRASTYNVLFITLVAIIGLTAVKILAVRMRAIGPLNGLADVILAA